MTHQKILTTTANRLTNSTGTWFGPLDVLTALWRCTPVTVEWSERHGLTVHGAALGDVCVALERVSDCPKVGLLTLTVALGAGLRDTYGRHGGSLSVTRTETGCTITARPSVLTMYARAVAA